MATTVRPALTLLFLFTLLTGAVYPLLVTAVAQAAFPEQSNGSLISDDKGVRGSKLIGQPFDDPRYFWSRLSATTPAYNGGASSGSNLGPLNPALKDVVKARVEALRTADPGNTAPIPVDLVTASGSGLDPHISPAAALYQAKRVAAKRGLREDQVKALVAQHTEDRTLGVLGEPHVNVLTLNLALDHLR
jgi:K+-transporting ATPase ATPase C chain